jgi:hypothetical protein
MFRALSNLHFLRSDNKADRTRRLLFGALIVFCSQLAHALDVQDYLRTRENLVTQSYVAGLGSGYFWSNAYLGTMKNAKPLYCQNPQLSLGQANYINILESRIKQLEQRGRKLGDTPIELVLLEGLQQTFPCK